MRDFFMQVSPRLNIGLRCDWEIECRHVRAPTGSPGQPPFGRLLLLHQTAPPIAKVLAGTEPFRCTRTTSNRPLSGPRATTASARFASQNDGNLSYKSCKSARNYTFRMDRFIGALDSALRTLFATPRASRPCPVVPAD